MQIHYLSRLVVALANLKCELLLTPKTDNRLLVSFEFWIRIGEFVPNFIKLLLGTQLWPAWSKSGNKSYALS